MVLTARTRDRLINLASMIGLSLTPLSLTIAVHYSEHMIVKVSQSLSAQACMGYAFL